jgi:hypothetical protein
VRQLLPTAKGRNNNTGKPFFIFEQMIALLLHHNSGYSPDE